MCVPRFVFVFGSNEAGRHGKGAALEAKLKYGARQGNGRGLQGASYAVPTKDRALFPLPLDAIARNVSEFLAFAASNPDAFFFVTALGTGLAGYGARDIAPMFKGAPSNCRLPKAWAPWTEATGPLDPSPVLTLS